MIVTNGSRLPCLILAVLLCTLVFTACGCADRADSPTDSAKSVVAWIDELREAYVAGGMDGFQAVQPRMAACPELKDDGDYEIASMVLGFDSADSFGKEVVLATELRRLAEHIEQHPGQARAEWESLRNKLFSYCFGSSGYGMDDENHVALKLSDLYRVIAEGKRFQSWQSDRQLTIVN